MTRAAVGEPWMTRDEIEIGILSLICEVCGESMPLTDTDAVEDPNGDRYLVCPTCGATSHLQAGGSRET
jgi:hypothetical protein